MRARELGKGSYYGGGWSQQKKLEMDAIKFPERLGCKACMKLQVLWKFSENNLKNLRNGIARGRVDPEYLDQEAWIKCTNCTGKQVIEMKCSQCLRVKGLDGFTKAQRRDPDNARCITCVADHGKELVADDDKENNKDDDDDSDGVSNAHAESEFDESEASGGVSVFSGNSHTKSQARSQGDLNALNLENLNIATGVSSSKTSTGLHSSLASNGHAGSRAPSAALGGWQHMSRSRGGATGQGRKFMGYDPHGKAHSMVQSPSTAGGNEDSGDSDSGGTVTNMACSSVKGRQSERDARDARSNFANIAALGKRKPHIIPEEYAGRTVESYHDSDDDDDEEDFFTI